MKLTTACAGRALRDFSFPSVAAARGAVVGLADAAAGSRALFPVRPGRCWNLGVAVSAQRSAPPVRLAAALLQLHRVPAASARLKVHRLTSTKRTIMPHESGSRNGPSTTQNAEAVRRLLGFWLE